MVAAVVVVINMYNQDFELQRICDTFTLYKFDYKTRKKECVQ